MLAVIACTGCGAETLPGHGCEVTSRITAPWSLVDGVAVDESDQGPTLDAILDLVPGRRLRSVAVTIDPAGSHPEAPEHLPSLTLVAISAGAQERIAAATDPSYSEAQYDAPHAITLDLSAKPWDPEAVLSARLTSESGQRAVAGLRVIDWACGYDP